MGAFISWLEWADVNRDGKPSSMPHLQTSLPNQELLYEFTKFLDHLIKSYPEEAKAEFRRPLSWKSGLTPASFSGSYWTINNKSKHPVVSVGTKGDGSPMLIMEVNGEEYNVSIYSFEALHRFLQAADANQYAELQQLVQSNLNPFNIIFGVSSENNKGLSEAFDLFNQETDVKKKEQFGKLYKLLIALNSLDITLMQNSVKTLQKGRLLDPHVVEEEFQMLSAFCGRQEQHALVSLAWESDYKFSNGFRSPPWRQIYGEIAYITVKCRDKDPLVVTASKRGYFINKGYKVDEKGNEELDYEADSLVYPSLTELLRATSAHFSSHIDFQPHVYTVKKQVTEKVEHKEEETIQSYHATSARKEKKVVLKKPKANVEPSLKWRVLGLTNDEIKDIFKVKKVEKTKKVSNQTEEHVSDTEVSSEEEQVEKRQESGEVPAEFYQIQKLVKYLRTGNETATVIAICSLRDFDLTNEGNQLAIRDVGGLETLINLLDTENLKCKLGSLMILKDITQNIAIRAAVAALDGIRPMVKLLADEELQCLAAETISHCAKNAKNRSAVRKYGGIKKLVKLLKCKPGEEQIAISGALALATCSKSTKNKAAILSAGAIPLLATLLESQNESLLIPVVAILQECASDESYRVAIRKSGMIRFLVENLSSKNKELSTLCASAIFKCAEDDETRVLVRQFNGLVPLVSLLENVSNKELLVAATGAVWKNAQNLENVAAFNKLNTIKKLVGLMENQPEEVLVNVVGALGACAQVQEGRQAIRESNGITPLVNLLTGTNQAVLVNVTQAVGACALDPDCMAVIDRLDGVRLLWSLLKSPNPAVQASAAWAISPCIEHAKDAGEMVRSFVGGLELIVSLLKSDNVDVLASVCSSIANIAKDEENLAVITDHGVVPMLGKLANTKNDKLRKHLAEAVARCCHWGNNRVAFGAAGAVAPLVKYLKSPDEAVHRSTAKALHQLSMDPDNCITMHENGVVQLLLGMVGSTEVALQEAAAGTIGNIRRLALASEKTLE